MTRDEFIAAALRNPANEMIADQLFHLALPDAWLVSGCLADGVERADQARGRFRH